ncbi:thiamine pyrophosphate-binding protein [Rhodococcus sp. BP-252]|uniref:thiamine pyrophosphate-binding protein n=1 Tax=unclassified Rhodococcus (in: high G+C Gram-positive bacteria) TaxID=192944 RepID=UPI001C9B33F4|nr:MULTISPECIES: thiamine pyrophosphate-binding protein [unclassified Rhodococcus (in: high G+C Gram-positive bacteria)]MBY6414391.1 thiamine pyrophosphate-binding protein [Rhodococcus sp. BP-320]MBY6419528.1 thiamine pyrophosphate-binding protein [Rhodococcus sp. BP-321]MBY6424031.1 thiamine pyrophosphate-binding protein [Rhodococcus sp. BP-324]MBY6429242.1 thiamine pyrophosphate-binding protein [Rhodococcus sp. BP-323]MBY6434201.1 thiamine pyrophosphate-binding protein [Rhodococcus sp. BP-32
MYVREVIGRALYDLGVRVAFGVVGSGNFHYTNSLVDAGARFVAARHEGGAAVMADAHARMSEQVTVLSLHQGCGYTNALTGIVEAAKSRSPLLVLTAEATDPKSNFYIDQESIARGCGAVALRIRSAATAVSDLTHAYDICALQRRTVVLNIPIDVQDCLFPGTVSLSPTVARMAPRPQRADLEELAALLEQAERPVFVAGRGARGGRAKHALAELADRCGALLATSAVSRGMFEGQPWSIDVAGGFSTPLAAELITDADLIVGWGCTLNMWTMRHGRLIGDSAKVVQVDIDQGAIGRNRPIDLGVWAGVAETAADASALLAEAMVEKVGYRTNATLERIQAEGRWHQVPFDDASTDDRIDPRAMSAHLNRLLPRSRVLSVDSGNFLGYPSMYLDVPDEYGFCFTQAFQSVGLGLATAIGAAIAQPDRVPIAACGDGGFLMGISELETAVRMNLPMLVVVYNDAKYGAEVHHFGTDVALDAVTFPDTDIAAIARGYGCEAITVRGLDDLLPIKSWLDQPDRPMVLDAKIISDEGSWWLVEAFGH